MLCKVWFYYWLHECFYMFRISCFERSTCLTNIKFGTDIIFKFVYTCGSLLFLLGVVCHFIHEVSLECIVSRDLDLYHQLDQDSSNRRVPGYRSEVRMLVQVRSFLLKYNIVISRGTQIINLFSLINLICNKCILKYLENRKEQHLVGKLATNNEKIFQLFPIHSTFV